MEGITSFSIPSFSVNFALNTVEGETTFNASGSGHVMVPEGLTETWIWQKLRACFAPRARLRRVLHAY